MRVKIGGPSGPLIVAINSIVNFQVMVNVYNDNHEEYELMNLLTIEGIKESLQYVRDHADIKYHTHGARKGMMVAPETFTPEQSYSLFLTQKFTPKLTVQFQENFSGLTIEGQELLDILSDTVYLDKISEDLKTIGYTNPSDRQIFREVRRRMDIVDFVKQPSTSSVKDLFREFFIAAKEVGGAQPVALEPAKHVGSQTLHVAHEELPAELDTTVYKHGFVGETVDDTEVAESASHDESVGNGLVSSNPSINVSGGRKDRNKGKN